MIESWDNQKDRKLFLLKCYTYMSNVYFTKYYEHWFDNADEKSIGWWKSVWRFTENHATSDRGNCIQRDMNINLKNRGEKRVKAILTIALAVVSNFFTRCFFFPFFLHTSHREYYFPSKRVDK